MALKSGRAMTLNPLLTENTHMPGDGLCIVVYKAHVEICMNAEDIGCIIRTLIANAHVRIAEHDMTGTVPRGISFVAEFSEWDTADERLTPSIPGAVQLAKLVLHQG